MTPQFADNFRSPAALARFFLTAAVGLAADLGTKAWASAALDTSHHADVRLIPGLLHFTFVENRGAVFGMAQGYTWVFVLVSIGALAFLTYLFGRSGNQRLYQFVLGLLLAGVLGNLYDRIRYGHVRDMIQILSRWNLFPWVFNVADILLCVGVGLLILTMARAPKPDQTQA